MGRISMTLSLAPLLAFVFCACAVANETRLDRVRPRKRPDPTTAPAPQAAGQSPVVAASGDRLLCIDEDTTFVHNGATINALDHILETMFANQKNSNKYNGYIDVFNYFGLSNEELQRRVVYTETISAGQPCSSEFETIAYYSASVIQNRIQRRTGEGVSDPVRAVLFKRDQFATAFNSYGRSNSWGGGQGHFADFLCPQNQSVWNMADSSVTRVQNPANNAFSPQTAHYYFPEHFTEKPDLLPAWHKDSAVLTRTRDGEAIPQRTQECMMVEEGIDY